MPNPETCFQRLILKLQDYWAREGCIIMQPYDMEVGAGTFHPATTLRALGAGSLGAPPMSSPRVGRRMGAMARIPTGCSISTNSR